jgi:2-polyprenyl-3-methyl-5-hydroxy-6-metoxy-1,4-benzoquinol methylase
MNLLSLQEEQWRPPVYLKREGWFNRLKLMAYGFLDLQYATINRDLSIVLPKVRGTVLDVGCGVQPYRGLFDPSVKYIGIDTTNSKTHFGYETPDTLYYSGDRWPVENISVDFILCTETLEHVQDPTVFLKEAARVLRPSGEMVLTVPFAARWHFIPYDYWRYTPSGLQVLLEKAGFGDIQVYPRGNSLTVACYKVMAFIFGLLFPASAHHLPASFYRICGILFLPILLPVAIVANLTIGMNGAADCLGYTVIAERSKGKS